MTANLEKLNGLVLKDMATLVQLKYEISPYLVSLFKDAIREEKEKFKHLFSQTVIQFDNDLQLKHYIGNNQQSLIDLASQLVAYADPQKINSKALAIDCSILCQFLYSSIEDLLEFVTKHYPKHAHSDAFVTQNYRMIIISDVRSSKQLLESRLTDLNVDQKIIHFTLQPFEDFSNANINYFTYRNVIYLKELRQELNELIFKNTNFDLNLSEAIQWKLMQLNYNSIGYFKFWTEQIAVTLDQNEDRQDKLNSLLLIKKRICQLQVKPHISYDPTMKPLKDILCDWIEQELNYLKSTNDQSHEDVSEEEIDASFKEIGRAHV